MTEITAVEAWEVLDSRGNPTVRVAVAAGGERGQFTVPAGASTGRHEALERRDGGDRYGGLGVRKAVEAVEADLEPVAVGREVTDQRGLDATLEAADGTDSLSNLGANAVLGVSGAALHAGSAVTGRPLYEHVADVFDGDGDGANHGERSGPGAIPLPMVNVLSGGLHARGGIEIQDFLVVPVGATDYPEALEVVWDVRSAVREAIEAAGHRPLVADEGGFAPPLATVDDAFSLLERGVQEAGYDLGDDVAFAVDVAASHFYDAEADTYRLDSVDRTLDGAGMVDLVAAWVDRYPLVSVEDPLHEDDWAGWQRLTDRVDDVQILGDDLLVTDRDRLDRAIETDAATAVLVKPNQAGTVSRALEVVDRASAADLATVVSARSGETCDATIADLAVGLDAGQIKIGSLARSERLAKYNRLLGIDRRVDLGFAGDRVL